ncbi:MAG: gfo/Idh/MocA family oxidoreductase, partial [Planctomycetaceae bacterium]|nr:gfo/Idh/MocA family oxidoreductase [Planctomycetaceae bacterium]
DFAATAAGPVATPLTLFTPDGRAIQPELPAGDSIAAFVAELTEVCRSIRTGKPSPLLAGELARDALVICQREAQAVRTGKPVRV